MCVCVRWEWKRKPITWCTSLSRKTDERAQRLSFSHWAAGCQQNVRRCLKCRRLHKELPTRSTFPGTKPYSTYELPALFIKIYIYILGCMYVERCHTKTRAENLKPEQRNKVLQLCSPIPTQTRPVQGGRENYSERWSMLLWNQIHSKLQKQTEHVVKPFTVVDLRFVRWDLMWWLNVALHHRWFTHVIIGGSMESPCSIFTCIPKIQRGAGSTYIWRRRSLVCCSGLWDNVLKVRCEVKGGNKKKYYKYIILTLSAHFHQCVMSEHVDHRGSLSRQNICQTASLMKISQTKWSLKT